MESSLSDVAEVLVSAEDLRRRVRELGEEIGSDYPNLRDPLLLVGVLKGSTLFMADLLRALPVDSAVDFMSISSYASAGHQSGIVRILKDLEGDVGGRDVLIVEDIVDTGLTLNYLRKSLLARAPRSLRTVTLLDKAVRRIVPVELEYSGFEIPDAFVVGYGLDFQGRYRNVREILAVRDLARLANDPLLLVDPIFSHRSSRTDLTEC